jgi:NADP-dependent 3-hydroxy acid dehydrogenase YdfG
MDTPKIPYISGLTGTWITRRQAISPEYWARHMTETIRFADGVSVLIKESDPVFIQPGSDRGIPLYVNQNPLIKEENMVLNMIRHQKEKGPDTAYLLDKIGHSWSSGVNIHWNAFYNGEKRNRIPLPAYSFERTSYPSSGNIHEIRDRLLSGESMSTRRKDMEDWFYIPVWEQSFTAKEYTPERLSGSSWLVFLRGEGPGKEIVRRLRRFARIIIVVEPGKTFEKTGELEFTVNPGNPDDYDALLEELSKTREIPQRVLHLWNLDEYKTGETILHELDRTQDLGLYSLLNLVKALGNQFITNDLRLDIVTCCMQEVTGEEKLFPVQATVLGAVKIIPLEYRNIFCRSIDMEIDTPIDLLMRELCIDSPDKITALRGNQRWLQNIKAVRLEETGIPGGCGHLVEKGVYLITGGLGGLGFTFARHLAQNCKARLILIDTAEFPARETWDRWIADNGEQDSISRKILEIRELEKGDAEFLVYNADVSDYPAMKHIVKEAEKCTSHINGVIHTAGLLDYEGAIQKRTREMTERLLAAKVKGTLVLDEILKEKQLDFWVFSSSLGNILYGVKFGQVGYNAGHEFLDVFARYKQKQGTRAVTIDWTDWLEVGMILEFTKRLGEEKYRALGQDDPFCITPAEGAAVFLRILHSPLPQAAVSPLDLHAMMEYHNNPKSNREIPGEKFENESQLPGQKKQERPSLSTQYASPRDEAERKAAEVFQQFFEVERVGIYDDFYEMGGDSLKAVQLASLMKKSGIPIHFHQLLLHRNIDEICRNLAQKGKTGMDMENIELNLSRKYDTAVYYRTYPYGELSCRVLFIAGESFKIGKVLEDIEKKTGSGTAIYPDFVVFIAPGVPAPEPEDVDDDGMTELLGLKDSLNENDRYKMLEELNENNRFTLLLKKNTRIRQYEVSPVQKFYLVPPFAGISTDFVHYSHDFLYPVDFRKIQDIVAALVQKNSLLRSVIVEREGSYFIEEFEFFSNIRLPLIDISSYSDICKTEITTSIVQQLNEPFDVLNNVLFRAVVLKVNHTRYNLLMNINHLIGDGTCIGLLEKQLRDLSGGIERIGEAREKTNRQTDYCDYVQFLKMQDYKNIQLENYVNLQDYSRTVAEILKKFKTRGLEHESFELDISIINEKNKEYYNEIVMLVWAAIIRDLFDVRKAPVSYLSNGRVYGGGDFNPVIGDFHDLVPVLFSRDEDPRAAIERFLEYKRFIRENNLNFMNYAVKGGGTWGGAEQLKTPFHFNSLIGSYEFFKKKRNEHAEKMVKKSKLSQPYFFMGVLEDFNAGKLWISFLHNSGFNVKEAFMKNYSQLVSTLNKTNEVNANLYKEEHK